MVDESIVSTVRQYLRNLEAAGIRVLRGVIFGSQVTGKTHPWSDIDVLVVSPSFDGEKRREDVSTLWRIAARTDSRIEPVAAGERQYREDDGNPILEIARREGEDVVL
jgi:predicted nucleotidyltransferase